MINSFYNAPELGELQNWLRGIFTHPEGPSAALRKKEAENIPANNLAHWIFADTALPLSRRAGVYGNAYFVRLLEALGHTFSSVKRSLGEERFRWLIAAYIQAYPSRSTNIEETGRMLPKFLSTHPFSKELGYLPDLAQLEWAVLEALYTERLPPLEPAVFHTITTEGWPSARFVLDPTVHLLRVNYAVETLWNIRLTSMTDQALPQLEKDPHMILVYRDTDWVQVRSLTPVEGACLDLMNKGFRLDSICKQVLKQVRRNGGTVPFSEWFTQWIGCGVIKKIEFGPQR